MAAQRTIPQRVTAIRCALRDQIARYPAANGGDPIIRAITRPLVAALADLSVLETLLAEQSEHDGDDPAPAKRPIESPATTPRRGDDRSRTGVDVRSDLFIAHERGGEGADAG